MKEEKADIFFIALGLFFLFLFLSGCKPKGPHDLNMGFLCKPSNSFSFAAPMVGR